MRLPVRLLWLRKLRFRLFPPKEFEIYVVNADGEACRVVKLSAGLDSLHTSDDNGPLFLISVEKPRRITIKILRNEEVLKEDIIWE